MSNWKEINADWRGESTFVAKNPTGGSVQMGMLDGAPGVGPMELLLAGLAGCTGMDIASILIKMRQPLQDLKIKVRGKMADSYPKIYTEIHVSYYLWGDGLDPRAVEQAIQLSEEKYCSVGITLRAATPVLTHYVILKPGEIPSEEPEMIHDN